MAAPRPSAPDRGGPRILSFLSIGALAVLSLAIVTVVVLGLGGVTLRYRREILMLQGALAGFVAGGLIGYVAGWLNGRRR